MLELLKEPAIILLILEIVAIVVGKLDKSDTISNLIIKLGEVLKSKKKKK